MHGSTGVANLKKGKRNVDLFGDRRASVVGSHRPSDPGAGRMLSRSTTQLWSSVNGSLWSVRVEIERCCLRLVESEPTEYLFEK